MRLASYLIAAAAATMTVSPAFAAPAAPGNASLAPAGWSLSQGAAPSSDPATPGTAGDCTSTRSCDALDNAKSARASTPVKAKNKAMGGGILIAILAAAAVIAGIVVVAN